MPMVRLLAVLILLHFGGALRAEEPPIRTDPPQKFPKDVA
jgi:hypothetical protein